MPLIVVLQIIVLKKNWEKIVTNLFSHNLFCSCNESKDMVTAMMLELLIQPFRSLDIQHT